MPQNNAAFDAAKKAILSLVLLVPAPSIGVLSAMVFFPDTTFGKGIFAFSKVWLLGLPLLWYLWVDKGKVSVSPVRKGGFGFGVLSGLMISAIILVVYVLLGDYFLDKHLLAEKIRAIGLGSLTIYAGGAVYWICVNSVLEEYVWRWFVVKQSRAFCMPIAAVLVSALCFTIHHTIAMKVFMPWTATVVCSAGIFIGGALWSWIYVKYESIWPGYVSHAIVDLCVFGIGAVMLFD
jgi:membrane protease YdiL (CAAX protease family)